MAWAFLETKKNIFHIVLSFASRPTQGADPRLFDTFKKDPGGCVVDLAVARRSLSKAVLAVSTVPSCWTARATVVCRCGVLLWSLWCNCDATLC